MNEFNTDDGKAWIQGLLKSDIVTIKFKKADGSERAMKCTLKEDMVPKSDKESKKQRSDSALPVWDIEKESWRSFRYDSILSVEFGLIE